MTGAFLNTIAVCGRLSVSSEAQPIVYQDVDSQYVRAHSCLCDDARTGPTSTPLRSFAKIVARAHSHASKQLLQILLEKGGRCERRLWRLQPAAR